MGKTAYELAARVKLTREQKALISLAQRCQHTIDSAPEARKARDNALRQLAAEGVPNVAVYMAPVGNGRARLAEGAMRDAVRGRR